MCAAQSKIMPISATCIEYVHPWTDSCSTATAGLLLQAIRESFRIYSAVYTVRYCAIRAAGWKDKGPKVLEFAFRRFLKQFLQMIEVSCPFEPICVPSAANK